MRLSYRGSVNRWECDENDHLNVRFYVDKHWQTLVGGLSESGVSLSEPQVSEQLQVQHIRFLQESRIATPLSGYWGVVAQSSDAVDVVTELRQSFTQTPVSYCIHRLRGFVMQPEDEIPSHGVPRGLQDQDLPHAKLAYQLLPEYGFKQIGLGVVDQTEVDALGHLKVGSYMGRLSDSMPHLWGSLHQDGQLPDGQGGAVLEYRLCYHQQLSVGRQFSVNSGVAEVGSKIQRFAHLMFDMTSQQIVLSAEAVGLRMDLQARKSITLSQQQLALMREKVIRPV